MSAFSAALSDGFSSKRLRYVAVDDESPEYLSFLTEMLSEPSLQALSSESLVRPHSKPDVQHLATMYRKALLGVTICLLQPSPSPSTSSSTTKDHHHDPPTMIGTLCIGFGGLSDATRHNRNAYLGISLAAAHRGKGYGREALDWATDWAFRHAGLHTLTLTAISFNEVGVRLYESAGFVLEGKRREVAWVNREWHDELFFSMTEREWEKLRGLSKDRKR